MQQTDKYKLNLIETSDTFSPEALNENAQKLEAALEAVRAEAATGDAALDQRLQVFEAKRFAFGTYLPSVTTFNVSLGFRPRVVFILAAGVTRGGALFDGVSHSNGHITDDGFSITGHGGGSNNGTALNAAGTFAYVAFG